MSTGNLIRTASEWGAYIEKLHRADHFYCDLETDGLLAWGESKIVGIALKGPGLEPAYAPMRHLEGNIPIECLQDLAPLLQTKIFTNHNTSFDLRFLMKEGLPLPPRIRDTMVAARLLDTTQSAALKTLGARYLRPDAADAEGKLEELLKAHGLKSKAEMYKLHPSLVAPYACEDVVLVEEMEAWQRPHLERWGLYDLYLERCMYLEILLRAEKRGCLLDRPLTQSYLEEAQRNQDELGKELTALAGKDVNPGSSKQMQELLGVRSTAKKIIERLSSGDRRAQTLLTWRGWNKLKGTYLEAFLEQMDSHDILRSSYKISGTETGRLAMQDPNLHAVSGVSEFLSLKNVFVARPGYTLVEIDYSALELRLAAHFTRAPNLVDAFEHDESPHDILAKAMGIDRKKAKTMNFATLYGSGPKHLAEVFNLEKTAATKLLADYWKANPLVWRWKEGVSALAEKNGYIRLYSGHIRRFIKDRAESKGYGKEAYVSGNTVLQGTGAELMRRAIQAFDKRIAGSGAHMLLTVHDSVVLEIPHEEVNEVTAIVRDCMENTDHFSVPMIAEAKSGPSWGEMSKS